MANNMASNVDTTASRKSSPQKQERRIQRSAGFVPYSKKSTTADYCEFEDAKRHTAAIRSYLSEADHADSDGHNNNSFSRSRSLKKLMLRSNKSSKVPKSPERAVLPRKTSHGWKYRQIVTQHQFNFGAFSSSFQVNNIPNDKRKASLKGSQMRTMSGAKGLRVIDSAMTSNASEFHDSISDKNPNRVHRGTDAADPTSKGKGSETPLRFIEAPSIPLSPIKVSLDSFRAIKGTPDGLDHLTNAEPASKRPPPLQVPTYLSEEQPRSWDFAAKDSSIIQHAWADTSRSKSPQKGEVSLSREKGYSNTVAGMSHKYPKLPSFRQRVEDLRAVQSKRKHCESASQPRPSENRPLSNISIRAIAQESPTKSKASSVIEDRPKPPCVVSAKEPSEDAQSDASSGVISNAQSAIRMHVRTTGHTPIDIVNNCNLPMPGPAPTRALPSLPENQAGSMATAITGSVEPKHISIAASPVKSEVSVPPKSPKRQGYRSFPCDGSPKQTKLTAFPTVVSAVREAGIAKSPTSAPNRIPRKAVAFPQPSQNPENMGAATLVEVQEGRDTEATAQRSQDMTRTESRPGAYEDSTSSDSSIRNSVDHHEGITILPDIRNSYTLRFSPSDFHKQKASQSSEIHVSSNHQDKSQEASRPTTMISPIIVVADQQPTLTNISRDPSQTSQRTVRRSSLENRPQSIYSTTDQSSHLVSPSLQLPQHDDWRRARPLSAHSVSSSNTRPVGSRTPTPFTHHLLQRNQSNRSSYRASSSIAESTRVRDLEARLSAIEKQNVELTKAFVAFINASSSCGEDFADGLDQDDGFDDHGEEGDQGAGCEAQDEELLSIGNRSNGFTARHGDRSSVTESLYAGLENLLAVHQSDAGKRLSSSSFV